MEPDKEFCNKFGGKSISSPSGSLCLLNYRKLSEAGLDLERLPRNEFSAFVILYDYYGPSPDDINVRLTDVKGW